MKGFWVIGGIILVVVCVGIFSTSFGNEGSEPTYPYTLGKVIANPSLKIRSGLSTEYDCIGLLQKDDMVHIYGKIDDWYIIKTENNLVGAVFAEYIEGSYETEKTVETSANVETAKTSSAVLSQNEQIFFNLINNQRIENNLPELQIDENLLNVARLKAQDIVENKYFSHTSPKLGSFFEMLQNNQISYHTASENIARNRSADGAVESLMHSQSHKNNILSETFNYTGIAVVDSIDWGKVFVEIFIAK